MKKVLKFDLPWVARIPKGYKMLQMHPMYQDENRFTTLSGILEPQLGHAAIGTIPFFCHFTGVETIKAGTPVAQFILIPNEQEAEVIDLEDDKSKYDIIFKPGFYKQMIYFRDLITKNKLKWPAQDISGSLKTFEIIYWIIAIFLCAILLFLSEPIGENILKSNSFQII